MKKNLLILSIAICTDVNTHYSKLLDFLATTFKSKLLIGPSFFQINLLLFFLFITNTVFSQTTDNIYVISPVVGDTIDAKEKEKFRIFPYYKTSEYQYGIFYQLSDSTYLLKSLVKDTMVEKVFSKEEILWNKKMIGGGDNDKFYLIKLYDGSTFTGNILQKDSINVIIKTSSIPKIEIPVIKIKSITELNKSNYKNGSYWFSNPNATRYLFAPSAFNLKKGEGYYQNTYLFLNSFNVGITDNISIGGGIDVISTFISLARGSFDPIFFITPKVGFKVANEFHAGGGILYLNIPNGRKGRSDLGIAYGIGTLGTLDHNITGGMGWGFVEGEFSESPIITLSGMTRISKSTALVTENWFIPTDGYSGLYSYGIRFFGEKLAIDLAFINTPDIAELLIIGIPYVDFVVKF